MKQRNGFVSNSSSSSFVILDKTEKGEVSLPQIFRALGHNEFEETRVIADGLYEINDYLNDREWHNALKENLNNNYSNTDRLYLIEISYHDGMNEVFRLFKDMKKIEVVEDLS